MSDLNSLHSIFPRLVTPVYNTYEGRVIVEIIATEEPFSVPSDGESDAAATLQNALDACEAYGGGTVFLPVGKYKLSTDIDIPSNVTLRGDWRDPDKGSGCYGTVILAGVPSSDSLTGGLFRLRNNSGIIGITVFYPDQDILKPIPYPPVFEHQTTMHPILIQNCTLLNAYNGYFGYEAGDAEFGNLWNVKGTVLKTAINIGTSGDCGRIENCSFSGKYWSEVSYNDQSLEAVSPSRAAIDDWTEANATGITMAASAWQYIYGLTVENFKTGFESRVACPGSALIQSNGLISNSSFINCNTGIKIDTSTAWMAMQFVNCSIDGNKGEDPLSIIIDQQIPGEGAPVDDGAMNMFDSCTITGKVRLTSTTGYSPAIYFNNCSFNDWKGKYTIEADKGTLIVENCSFIPVLGPDCKAMELKTGLGAAVILSNRASDTGHTGCYNILDSYIDMDENLNITLNNNDLSNIFKNHNIKAHKWKPVLPEPVDIFTVVSADRTGETDTAPAIQAALDSLEATGGIVYLPAGRYRIYTNLVIPANVELRGSWNMPHYGMGGTVLCAYGDRSNAGGKPLITIRGNNAGVRGLTIWYPEQEFDIPFKPAPYPWSVMAGDQQHKSVENAYVIDVTFTNTYQGVNFGKYATNNHYLRGIFGTALKYGIYVSKSSEGWLESCHLMHCNWQYSDVPKAPKSGEAFENLMEYMLKNTIVFGFGSVKNEHVLHTFTIANAQGYVFDIDAEDQAGPEVTGINTGNDYAAVCYIIKAGDVTLVNALAAPAMGYKYFDYNNPGHWVDKKGLVVTGGNANICNSSYFQPVDGGTSPYRRIIDLRGGNTTLIGASMQSMNLFIDDQEQKGLTATVAGLLNLNNGTGDDPHIKITAPVNKGDIKIIGNNGKGSGFFIEKKGVPEDYIIEGNNIGRV